MIEPMGVYQTAQALTQARDLTMVPKQRTCHYGEWRTQTIRARCGAIFSNTTLE